MVKTRTLHRLSSTFLMSLSILLALGTLGSAQAQGIPDMTGSWVCPRDEGLIRGERLAWTLTFEVHWQEDRFFMGTYRWSVDEEHGVQEHSGGELTLKGEIDFQGVIDWDNRRVVMVDVGDTGTVLGTLEGEHTLHMIGFEAGEHPLVAAAICIRRHSRY